MLLTDERSLAPEILFNPSKFGLETMCINSFQNFLIIIIN